MHSISSLAASLTSAIEKEAKELEGRREQLEKERERLSEEKRRMSSFAAQGSDLVKINVGGKVFQTHRATLLSAEGSLLEAIFSGRWEESLVRDETGNVFFDFDPAPFRALLNFLRTRSLVEPGQAVPAPHVPEEHKAQMEAMISYMGLQDIIYGKAPAARREAMALSQAGSRGGSLTIAGGHLEKLSNDYCCIIGSSPLLHNSVQQKTSWKVSITQCTGWVLAGVTTNPGPPDDSLTDAGTFAWTSSVRCGGRDHGEADNWPGWQTGDVSIFQLDGPQRLLRMHLRRTGMVYTLRLPADLVQSARLHFNLFNAGDVLEVSQTTPEELAEVGFSRQHAV